MDNGNKVSITNIVKQNKELKKQINLLRNKFNQMHEALIYLDLLKIKEFDDPSAKLSPVEIINKNSSKTLLVFGGMATRPSMPPKEFFKSFMNRDINIIFIKDFMQCWYQKGLIGKSNDIQTTSEYLASIIPKETENLICLGTSAGGYAAIRFGVELNADRILAFAPQTHITKRAFNRLKLLDSRILDIDLNSSDLDLAKYLSKKSHPNIELYYGFRNENDVAAASHIGNFVKHYKFDTDTHLVGAFLKKKGLLSEILESI